MPGKQWGQCRNSLHKFYGAWHEGCHESALGCDFDWRIDSFTTEEKHKHPSSEVAFRKWKNR